MITIIHGDNTVLSRKQLQTEIEKHVSGGKTIRSLAGNELSLSVLTEALQPTSLFGDEQVLLLERLFRMRSKNLRDQMLSILQDHPGMTIIIWEDATVSATNLKLLQNAKPTIFSFKTSPLVFQAMDLFGNPGEKQRLLKHLHAAYDQDTPEFVFAMLTRQIRLLINVAEGETAALKPYTLQKIRHQAQFFPLKKLLQIHQQLLAIDLTQKQSSSLLSLEQQLDLLALQTCT
ncbi:hypothetical protein KA012_03840 [Candidatus Woesebacteria bacterium]|nr:hypothetical protein [Candidatus Woesebacteria bacterium]